MSRKYFTLAATNYFTRQFPGGGRNEIFWSFVGNTIIISGCVATYAFASHIIDNREAGTQERQQQYNGSIWF